jgi:oligopeptide/dipeptide ABC transporter ATP-binding protein
MSPILEISDLSVAYRTPSGDVHAVEQVNLTLNPGEVVGLCGESGSGKSTLAYGATRLLRPPALITSGSVRYYGRRITHGGEGADILALNHRDLHALRWREIAIVFQSAMNALNPVLRVRDQLLDAVTAHLRLPRGEARDKAAGLLDLVGIPRTRLRSYPHELSGGMRQRVMIAMALAADPEVVIMDEPTTALDVVMQRDILAQVVELKETLGFAVLFITHDLSLLLELADRIAVMYAGRLLETGASAELMRDPAHPYTRGLLRSFPSLRGERRVLTGIPGSPPDLLAPLPGCPFAPRCPHVEPACTAVDMSLERWQRPPGDAATDRIGAFRAGGTAHLTACPIVTPEVSQEGVLS